jgi:Tfp pilus assembly protein PilN
MIRVNLIGRASGKPARGPGRAPRSGGRTSGKSMDPLPVIWALLLLGALGGGYFWWSMVTGESARLDSEIAAAEAERARLQAVIDQDAVYEERKAEMERRIAAIEQLQRNRVSPVVSLDMLSQAVEDTQYVWISTLNQNNTTFNLNGAGTSIQAIETFITNLEATGYFRNINLVRGQQANPYYTFQLAMTFVPPLLQPASSGAAGAP